MILLRARYKYNHVFRLFLLGRADGTEKDQDNLLNCFVWIGTKYEILLTLLLVFDHSSQTSESNRRQVS